MTTVDDVLGEQADLFGNDIETGKFKPSTKDEFADCEFVRVGFRSWGLEAADHSWKMVLSKLDFGAKEPSALLTVYSEGHVNAIESLDWLVFNNSIGTNGGTNWNQCVKRLVRLLGASDNDWDRRLTYLVGQAKKANAGSNNGTFSTTETPSLATPAPYLFQGRVRMGRTISIYGAGSAGKTTLVDGLIASACSGREILPNWLPTQAVPSLILDWDEGSEEESVRLDAICRAYGIKLTAGYHYKRQARPLYDVADDIGAYIVANGIKFLVVSPMGRAQRNFGENMTAPVDEVHEILRSFGTTNVLIDHVTGDNMRGGAQREFGSVRKRDNVRGSYAVDVQSEEPGARVLVLRNTKADALMPGVMDQAIRIEYDPPWPKADYTYDTIRFEPDTIIPVEQRDDPETKSTRQLIRDALLTDRLTVSELSEEIGVNRSTIERVLYRYDSTKKAAWFARLPSGKWELLPKGRG